MRLEASQPRGSPLPQAGDGLLTWSNSAPIQTVDCESSEKQEQCLQKEWKEPGWVILRAHQNNCYCITFDFLPYLLPDSPHPTPSRPPASYLLSQPQEQVQESERGNMMEKMGARQDSTPRPGGAPGVPPTPHPVWKQLQGGGE